MVCRVVIFFVSVFLLLGCSGGKHDARLEHVAGIVSDSPREALSCLDSIDYRSLSTRDRHYRDFLSLKARDKAYIVHESDSLILDFLDYYSSDKGMYTEVLYYGGRVYSDLGDYPTALRYFQTALDEFDDGSDNLPLKSNILSQTGRLLNSLRLHRQAVPYLQESLGVDSILKDTFRLAYDHLLLGDIYDKTGEYDRAEGAFRKAHNWGGLLSPSHAANARIYLASAKLHEGKVDSALNIIRPISGDIRPAFRTLTAFGTLRVTSTTYNYSGLPLSTVMTEKDITVQTDNTYHDSTGLLLHTDVTVNGTRQRVSSLTYDDLGRVIADTRGAGAAVTGTSYTYDLHGRVTSISGPGFSQRLHYADGPGNRLYNGMISSMSWTMGNDATERGYRYSYNDCGWLTAAEYGEGSSLDSHKNRYTERFTEFMPNGGVRRLQRHGLKADGEYGKIDNLHIYYEGNRIKEVLEDAGPTTQTGSTDFSGKTGVRSSFEYNSWGALVRDDSRNISSVTYDNLGNPVDVEFSSSDGRGARYVYSAKGERLKAEHRVNVTVEVNPVSKAPQMSDGTPAGDISPITPNLLVTTRLEFHGPVVYRNGRVDRVLFSGGYATIDGGNVTFHYYTQDYQGSNRAVVNGTTGAVEQTVAYYPCGGVIADLGTGAGIQPCKFGGKELTLYNGLDEYDFGARQYYPAVPHFTRIDPLCEQDYWLSPYLYCANDPVNLTDPTGMSTRVKQLADGTYEVLGGDLTDDDKNIYLYNQDVNGQYTIKRQSIGITTSITSFYDSDKSMWKTGSIIDPNDKSGQKFLSNIINNNPPLFDDYIVNARNNHTYDFKVTNGTSKVIKGINIYRGMAIGFNSNGQTIYTSARDIGNIAAGYIAAANGLSWSLSRIGFDTYQLITSFEIEGLSTRNAERYGWKIGYRRLSRFQKSHNLSNSIKSPIIKASNKIKDIFKFNLNYLK